MWNIAEKEFSSQSHLTSSRNFNNNSYTFTSTSSGYAFAISNIKLKAGTYTISYNRLAGTSGDVQFIVGQNLYRTLTIADETTVTIRSYIPNASTNESFTIQLQIENNSSATTYEPYTEQTQLISLGSIELAKIGDYTDRIFKDNGKWYKYGAIGKVTVNGSEENWAYSSTNENFNIRAYYLGMTSDIDKLGYIPKMCNYFKYYASNGNQSGLADGIYENSNDSQRSFLIFHCNSLNITTLEAWKTWLNTNRPIIYYPLETPTTTEITDTTLIGQLENILKMRTIRNTTNGWIEPSGTNAQAGLTLTYKQDLATLIAG